LRHPCLKYPVRETHNASLHRGNHKRTPIGPSSQKPMPTKCRAAPYRWGSPRIGGVPPDRARELAGACNHRVLVHRRTWRFSTPSHQGARYGSCAGNARHAHRLTLSGPRAEPTHAGPQPARSSQKAKRRRTARPPGVPRRGSTATVAPKCMKAESRRSNGALDVVRVSEMVSASEPLVTRTLRRQRQQAPQDAGARCRPPGQITHRMECQ
jgi:hypothetical protein